MRKLYLLRHADSQKISQDSDFERVLSPKGIKELERLADFLAHHDFTPDIVLCSSAARTRQTWDQIQNTLKIITPTIFLESIYNARMSDMLTLIQEIDNKYNSALIVGHNPIISNLTTELVAGNGDNINFSPANIACLGFDIATWLELDYNKAKLEWLYSHG